MDGYKHILVPLDGSECSERALVEAERLQEAFGARLTLLYVVSDPDFDCTMGSPAVTNASVQRDCAEAEKYLARRVESYNGEAETQVVVGCVAKSILAATEKLGAISLSWARRGWVRRCAVSLSAVSRKMCLRTQKYR